MLSASSAALGGRLIPVLVQTTDAAMFQPARHAFCALVLSLLAGLGLASLPATAHAQLPYSASMFSQSRYAAIVVDANTGEVLYSRNADASRYPASITKLMTLYLVFEQLQSGRLSLDD